MKARYLILAALAACTIVGCDEVENTPGADGVSGRYELMPAVEVKRNVLLEEFTGQQCTNCPDAHRAIAALKEQYGDQFICVGIHSGVFGWAEADYGQYGLMQDEGDVYADHWKVPSYPAGMLDRSGTISFLTEWSTLIREELAKDSPLEMSVTASITTDKASGQQIEIATELRPSTALTGKLQLWVVENHIKAPQVDNGTFLPEYEHNHVYRASVNGTWGEEVVLGNIYKSVTHRVAVKPLWKPEDLSIVAFVYNDTGVVQVVEAKVKTADEAAGTTGQEDDNQ